MKNRFYYLFLLAVVFILILVSSVSAQSLPLVMETKQDDTVKLAKILSITTHVSDTISYQGLLEENGIPVTGDRDMDFSLYSDSNCINFVSGYIGISDVPVESGLFSVEIDVDQSWFNGQQLFLLVEVENVEITCQEVFPVPYALSLRPGAIITSESTDYGASALIGEISSNSPGGYSAGLRGINKGTGVSGIGVLGSQDGSGWGVFGQVDGSGRGVYGVADGETGVGVYGVATGDTGIGVVGYAESEDGIGVHASGNAFTGTAMLISTGSIRVNGAGLGSSTPVFIHQATAENIWGLYDQNSNIDHPLTNGDPNAILIITKNGSPYISGVEDNPYPVGVSYHTELPKWYIYNIDDSPMPIGATFNILVVKP